MKLPGIKFKFWHRKTHNIISNLALNTAPAYFKNFIIKNETRRGFFELGIIAPDRLFMDSTNHYYNCTPSKSGLHYGRLCAKVAREAAFIKRVVRHPDMVILHKKTEQFLKGIIDSPDKALAFELGVLSHYLADAHQPFHTDGPSRVKEIDPAFDENPAHRAFEEDVCDNLDSLIRGYMKSELRKKKAVHILDYQKFILSKIKKSNKYYIALYKNYRLLNNTNSKIRFKKVMPLTQRCFNEAVYSIQCVFSNLIRQTRPTFKKFIKKYQ